MARGGQVQQFGWVSAESAKEFIDRLNDAGQEGYELYSTYKVVDKFMGALMIRWTDRGDLLSQEPLPPVAAKVLKLVRDDDDKSLSDGVGEAPGREGAD